MKIAVTGAAGLVGQNLIARLKGRQFRNAGPGGGGQTEIVAIDKHPANTRVLRELHPDITVVEADMARRGPWEAALDGVDAIVVGHAQIGGLVEREFTDNNLVATERLLDAVAARGGCHLVHISSSVVNSAADDFYTRTKAAQEAMVLAAGHPTVVLRPTLMFGWFDRKHLGWLARFMRRAPVFPVPGSGDYLRQPLYAGDFCEILIACLEQRAAGVAYNISGQERITYIELMRLVREAVRARAPIIRVPYRLFWLMLAAYAVADRNPPFTTKQLEALVTPDIFEVIDWPGIFGVRATPLRDALFEAFRDPRYAAIALEF
jgi:nucleoside-diphosphate-sugar epimerase